MTFERGTNAWELESNDAEWLDRPKPLDSSVVQAPKSPFGLYYRVLQAPDVEQSLAICEETSSHGQLSW